MVNKFSPKAQGYQFLRSDGRGMAIFREIATGRCERYARRPGGVAGWHIQYHGAAWEFCNSSDIPENKPEPVKAFVEQVARLTLYTFPEDESWTDDQAEDAIVTLNALIAKAREL